MATRFYFIDGVTGTPPTLLVPTFDAAWGDTEDAVRRWLSDIDEPFSDAFETLTGDEAVATSPLDVLVAQFISGPLEGAQTITGTVKGQIRASEANIDADYRAQVVIRVVSRDGTSVTGTLLAADTSALSSEFATALTNRKFPLAASSPVTLSSVSAVDGDRIVIEVGFRSHNAHTTSRLGSLRIGRASATDLAEDETTTTDNNPWLEFSQILTFESVERQFTGALYELAGSSTPIRQFTGLVLETAGQKSNVQRMFGDLMWEVAVESHGSDHWAWAEGSGDVWGIRE